MQVHEERPQEQDRWAVDLFYNLIDHHLSTKSSLLFLLFINTLKECIVVGANYA